jgi:hypothetical protein
VGKDAGDVGQAGDRAGHLAVIERAVAELADRCAGGRGYEYATLCIHWGDGVPDTVVPVSPPHGGADGPRLLAGPPPRGVS